MNDNEEMRRLMGLVQSHLDKHDVQVNYEHYDVEAHLVDGEQPFEVEGQTVRVSFEYSFSFDDAE